MVPGSGPGHVAPVANRPPRPHLSAAIATGVRKNQFLSSYLIRSTHFEMQTINIKLAFCLAGLLFCSAVLVQAQTDVSQYNLVSLSFDSKCKGDWVAFPSLVQPPACFSGRIANESSYWVRTFLYTTDTIGVQSDCVANTCSYCKRTTLTKSSSCTPIAKGVYATAFRPDSSISANVELYSTPDCTGEFSLYPVKGALCYPEDFFSTGRTVGDLYVAYDGVDTIGLGRYCGAGCTSCPVFDQIPFDKCVYVFPGRWAKATR
jgi:hypothetical protein